MSDEEVRELKALYYATGSPGDEAAWIAARMKTGEDISTEALTIGHICGNVAFSLVLDQEPIEGEITILTLLEALDLVSREAVIRAYLAIIVDWAERQEQVAPPARQAILTIIRLFAATREDWAIPEISESFEGLLLERIVALNDVLPPQNEPYEEHIAEYSLHDMLSSLLFGICRSDMNRLAGGIYNAQSNLFAGIERQDTENALLTPHSKAVIRQALEPWALGLRDPLDSIVERLEQLWP